MFNFFKKEGPKVERDVSSIEKSPFTFIKLLEELKSGYVLEEVKDLPVLVNGKPVDHIGFGQNGGIDFVSK